MNEETFYDCPKCPTGKLVRRTNKKTGETFLGCNKYPSCSYTQKDEEPPQDE